MPIVIFAYNLKPVIKRSQKVLFPMDEEGGLEVLVVAASVMVPVVVAGAFPL